MYDRAVRKLNIADERTPAHVGPGTYPRHEISTSCTRGKLTWSCALIIY